jgi:hypothetical protein
MAVITEEHRERLEQMPTAKLRRLVLEGESKSAEARAAQMIYTDRQTRRAQILGWLGIVIAAGSFAVSILALTAG